MAIKNKCEHAGGVRQKPLALGILLGVLLIMLWLRAAGEMIWLSADA
jgi:hypothetical protein